MQSMHEIRTLSRDEAISKLKPGTGTVILTSLPAFHLPAAGNMDMGTYFLRQASFAVVPGPCFCEMACRSLRILSARRNSALQSLVTLPLEAERQIASYGLMLSCHGSAIYRAAFGNVSRAIGGHCMR